jgi:hypothetical protein
MSVVYILDEMARGVPQARHALETLAVLMGYPTRFAQDRSGAGPEDVPIWVGRPLAAGAQWACVIELVGWEPWDPPSLALATFQGRPLLCPGGAVPQRREGMFPVAWLRSVGYLLAREEETADRRRDRWGCYAGNFTRLSDLGVLERPLVHDAAAELGRCIEAWNARRGLATSPPPRWKNGARFAAVLSHDVDDLHYTSLTEAFRLLGRARSPGSYAVRRGLAQIGRGLGRLGATDDPFWRFDAWATEEERSGFRSTWFVFPPHPQRPHEFDPLYRLEDSIRYGGKKMPFRDVLRDLAKRGFEIGLHASYESFQTPARLRAEKEQIERAVGVPLSGIRQHFLRFDVSQTWAAQQGAGFDYDSTLGYNEAIGFRAGIAAPFRPWNAARGAPHGLLELPLAVMDGVLFRTLGLDGAEAARRTIALLETVEAAEGLAVLLWHPNGADAAHYPGWWDSYREVLAHLSARSAWVATAGEINSWWREREKTVLREA